MSPTSSPTDYTEISEIPNQDPFGMFLYSIRANETRRQYTSKLKAFFDFIGLKGTLEKQAAQSLREPVKDSDWALNAVIRFVNFQKGRVTKKSN